MLVIAKAVAPRGGYGARTPSGLGACAPRALRARSTAARSRAFMTGIAALPNPTQGVTLSHVRSKAGAAQAGKPGRDGQAVSGGAPTPSLSGLSLSATPTSVRHR